MDERAACFGAEDFGGYLSGRRNFLRLELCLRQPEGPGFEASPDPFVRVVSSSRLGELYLTRLRSCDGALDRFTTLKLLGDARRPQAGGTADPNPVQNRLFLEEYRSLRLLKEGDPDPLLRLTPFDLKTDGGVDLTRLAPLTFCKRRRLFFNPRCSRCGQVLRDCRDDDVLLRFGLKSYAASSARYLCCHSCVRDGAGFQGGAKRFFTRSPDDADRSVEVLGDELDLVAAFGELVAQGPSGITEFPCAQCASSATCYPQDPRKGAEAQRLLVPFSFHDFCAFVHEFLPLRFDEGCDLVGGRRWDDAALPPEQAQAVRELASKPLRLFFEGDLHGREALEIFLLKLSLAGELCRGVLALQRRFGTPHLNLRPENVWVGLTPGGGPIPGFWSLRVRVGPPDHPVPVPGSTEGGGTHPPAFRAPDAPHPIYAPPAGAGRAVGAEFDLYGVGMLLMRALVGNRFQDPERLSQVVGGALFAASRAGRVDAETVLGALPASVWDPGNVVYEPRAGGGDSLPAGLWRRALLVPLGLVAAAGQADDYGGLEHAVGELERLRDEVRRALFLEPPGAEAEIGAVLGELIDDPAWLAAVEAGRAPRVELPPRLEPIDSDRVPSALPPEEDSEDTVVLGRGAAAAAREIPPAPAAPPLPKGEDFEATVVLGRGAAAAARGAPPAPAAPAAPAPPGENFEATVILGRGARVPPPAAAPAVGAGEPSPDAEPSDPDETVILPAGSPRPKGSGER